MVFAFTRSISQPKFCLKPTCHYWGRKAAGLKARDDFLVIKYPLEFHGFRLDSRAAECDIVKSTSGYARLFL
jgi:hypothetical protein